MHVSTLLTLIFSLGQSVLANPVRIDITIDDHYPAQSLPVLSALDGPYGRFVIRVVPVQNPSGPKLFLNRNPPFAPTGEGQVVLSQQPGTFALQDNSLTFQPFGPLETVQFVQGGKLALVKSGGGSISWTMVHNPRVPFGQILEPSIDGQVQGIRFRVDGYTPNAQVSLCGAQFESCDGKPSVYLVVLPIFDAEDSFELRASHAKLQMDSATEGHLQVQSNIPHTVSGPDCQDLPYPFKLHAATSNGSPTDLFLDVGLLPIFPPWMALRPNSDQGIFHLEGGKLVYPHFNGDVVQPLEPIGEYGPHRLGLSFEQSSFGWISVEHHELGLVLAPTVNGEVLDDVINAAGLHADAELFVCGRDVAPCGGGGFTSIYLRIERAGEDFSLDTAYHRPGHNVKLLEDL